MNFKINLLKYKPLANMTMTFKNSLNDIYPLPSASIRANICFTNKASDRRDKASANSYAVSSTLTISLACS